MEIVTVKFKEEILKKMDTTIANHDFNSRTEFIREAVRDKLSILSTDELIKELMKFKGKAKIKTTYEENRKVKEQVSKELMKELDKRFS
ncbi:MAG: ribbon-helix-helix domain-containing protein [Nanoarchaeota archaeon]|nr:ribbon-helix-helix domain-containing protein [Nanoarchaeota archaeon]